MTELEKKMKAKIPGEDTGIEIRHSLCAICSPSHHCGLDCYVKDGEIIRVEDTVNSAPKVPPSATTFTGKTGSKHLCAVLGSGERGNLSRSAGRKHTRLSLNG